MEPSALLLRARALSRDTQDSLAQRLCELFPKKPVTRHIISKWERNRAWRPRPTTWYRLRAALYTLPELPQGRAAT